MKQRKFRYLAALACAAACLLPSAQANTMSERQSDFKNLLRHENRVAGLSRTSITDAMSAYYEASRIWVEISHRPGVSRSEREQARRLLDQAAANLKHAQGLNSGNS